ncbi:YraN family protein [Nitrosomonas sp. JL21]|uniref:YraN family protein n=1 Tax=Nitrosomonas sp. JL21 TaxID=153949 RepID=UPI00136E4809|nr:YraN family protein [Nitrosomonas sp. JL21]MBL8496246.1 YraN family protein [Nitrosomonas sp.]MCC7091577.1 YraN family protein [Nitrosomonas sp.]MXS76986.1 YraN family protein [Nitrosomonas sp. JL21]
MKGNDAEYRALAYLQRQHLQLIVKNYRCRFGEIDLIMREGSTLVFIEVRQRSTQKHGGAAGSITAAKQAKLLQTARHYLAEIGHEPACRFDALLLSGSDGEHIEWIKNAFGE